MQLQRNVFLTNSPDSGVGLNGTRAGSPYADSVDHRERRRTLARKLTAGIRTPTEAGLDRKSTHHRALIGDVERKHVHVT